MTTMRGPGECPVCGAFISLNRDGRLRVHRDERYECWGSGMRPDGAEPPCPR